MAKVAPPELPAVVVAETRASRLLAGSPAPVTVLVAPPGAGKTVTLTSWLASTPPLAGRVAWATLDRDDNDVASLWTTLLAALRANPSLASDPGIAELSSAPTAAGVDEGLIRQLGALIGPQDPPFVLVLDDLHQITDPEALSSLELLLRRRPPGLALVLSARYRPGIALHRLQLDSPVREVGPQDFVLDLAEAGELLASLGHDLAVEDVDALWRRTEGWVAALRLAASELQRGADPQQVARTFGGSTPTVADLLVVEVLDHLPSAMSTWTPLCGSHACVAGKAASSPPSSTSSSHGGRCCVVTGPRRAASSPPCRSRRRSGTPTCAWRPPPSWPLPTISTAPQRGRPRSICGRHGSTSATSRRPRDRLHADPVGGQAVARCG